MFGGGGTASVLYKIAEEQNRELYLFDLFESDNCLNAVRRFCPKAHIIKGRFPDSWPGNIDNIAFFFLDIVEAVATEYLMNKLWPSMFVKGGAAMISSMPEGSDRFKEIYMGT